MERGYIPAEEEPAYEASEEGPQPTYEAPEGGPEPPVAGLEGEIPTAEELQAEVEPVQAEAEGLAGRLRPEVLRKLRQLAREGEGEGS